MAYRHDGFWQPMDTLRDVRLLESLWQERRRAVEGLVWHGIMGGGARGGAGAGGGGWGRGADAARGRGRGGAPGLRLHPPPSAPPRGASGPARGAPRRGGGVLARAGAAAVLQQVPALPHGGRRPPGATAAWERTFVARTTCSRSAAGTPILSSGSSSPRATRRTARATRCRTPRRLPLAARHPYEVSKAAADLIAQSYHHTYGLPVAIARCGTSTAAAISTGAESSRARSARYSAMSGRCSQ